MTTVALDPQKYSGTYKLIGGELSLDFINTISYPGTSRSHDWLDPAKNFILWAEAAGIVVSKQLLGLSNEKLEAEMPRIRQTRKILSEVLKPFAFGKQPSAVSIKKLNLLLPEACAYRYIDKNGYQWKWARPTSLFGLAAPVIWNAAYVITELDHSRLGYCGGCDWLFYDSTRNRSRKWCDMEDCGSRDKALRYYHRTKN